MQFDYVYLEEAYTPHKSENNFGPFSMIYNKFKSQIIAKIFL